MDNKVLCGNKCLGNNPKFEALIGAVHPVSWYGAIGTLKRRPCRATVGYDDPSSESEGEDIIETIVPKQHRSHVPGISQTDILAGDKLKQADDSKGEELCVHFRLTGREKRVSKEWHDG